MHQRQPEFYRWIVQQSPDGLRRESFKAPGGQSRQKNGAFPLLPVKRYSNSMKVISFSIFKGGTGKTTSSVNTAAALMKKGKKVLLVDLDQQASSTRYLDLDPEQSPNLYDVFIEIGRASCRERV